MLTAYLLRSLGQKLLVLTLPLVFLWCCGPQSLNAQFLDRTQELGLQLSNSGACWADLNQDGWSDLCAGGTAWRNERGTGFTPIASGLGDVIAADFDNDGYPDLFCWGNLTVYRNEAGKSFAALPALSLPPDQTRTVSLGACAADFNGDGFVDLYVGGYEDWENQLTFPDLLYLNEGSMSFRLAWHEASHRARGITACDFDEDRDFDVYVSNYRLQPNQLWENDGQGNFRDIAQEKNVLATSEGFRGGHSIGSAWGDFDADGHFDLFAGNFAHVDSRGDQPKSRFLRNLGPQQAFSFEDRGTCGVDYQESYATPAAGDFDNDGRLDLFFTTVYETASFGKKNNPVLLRNEGDFQFSDQTAAWKLEGLPATYQAAWSDFDQDGDLDLVTAGRLFVNQAPPSNWLDVQLTGTGPRCNRSAIGAQVRVFLKNQTLTRQVEAGTGQGNQNDLLLHFGLGPHAESVRLEIRWPDGTATELPEVAPHQVLRVKQPE